MINRKGTVDIKINSNLFLTVEYIYHVFDGILTIDYDHVWLKSTDISEIISDETMQKIDEKIKQQEGWKDEQNN